MPMGMVHLGDVMDGMNMGFNFHRLEDNSKPDGDCQGVLRLEESEDLDKEIKPKVGVNGSGREGQLLGCIICQGPHYYVQDPNTQPKGL